MAGSPVDNWIRQHAAGEKLLAGVLRKYFVDQADRFFTAFAGYDNPTEKTVGKIWKPKDEHKRLIDAITDPLLGMMATGAEQVLKQKPKTKTDLTGDLTVKAFSFGDFDLPKRVKQAIESSFTELEKQSYWQDIQSTTEERITAVLSAALEEGLSVPGINKKLRSTFDAMEKVRATAIARTETTLAYNEGHQVSYSELAAEGFIETKQWLAVVDDDTRETHEDLNEVEVAVDNEFDVGGSTAPYPGHWSLPAEERVNCRCTTVAVFE